MTIDYRALNKATSPLTATVPSIVDIVNTINECAFPWMGVLDIKDMFFMIPIQEQDKPKFAFT